MVPKKSRNTEYLSLASSVALIIPVLIGLGLQEYTYTVLASIVFVGSTLFHITKPEGPVWWTGKGQTPVQVLFLYVDTIASLMFGGYVTWLLIDEGDLLKIGLVAALFVPTFYIYFRGWGNYELEHAIWHIAASILALAPFTAFI
jgi:hypothetical protein